MVATGNELSELGRAQHDGARGRRPPRRRRAARRASPAWRRRCATASTSLLESQGVRLIRGTGRLVGAYTVDGDTDDGVEEIEADAILLVDRLAAARPRVGDDRRRAHPHDPPGVPAARDPRAPRRDRLGRHRRRVHAHVQRARLAGVADRVAPAGAADQGPRGRGRARERVPPAGREAAEGRARDRRSAARATRCSSRATTAARVDGSHALLAIGSLPEHRGARLRGGGRRGRRQRLRPRQPPLPDQRAAHLLGGRHLGPAAAVVGRGDAGPQDRRARDGPHRARAPPPRLRQGRAGDLHRSRDRRGRRRRGRGVRGGPQAARHEGAVLRRTRSRSSTATRAAS